MTGERRAGTSRLGLIGTVLGVATSVLVTGLLAGPAGAGAKTLAGPSARGAGAEPQPWMIIGGLATVPIALLALAALFRHAMDAITDAAADQKNPTADDAQMAAEPITLTPTDAQVNAGNRLPLGPRITSG